MRTHSITRPVRSLGRLQTLCTCLLAAVPGLLADSRHAHSDGRRPASAAPAAPATAGRTATELPPLPDGVAELKFSDLFVRPVGPVGLELTARVKRLDGRRVRILGYMVRQEDPPPGRLLFAPMPAEVHEHDNALAEDLPASTVYVSVPTLPDKPVPHVPGLMLLTGTLSLGNRTEPDGRISVVRLALDPPSPATR